MTEFYDPLLRDSSSEVLEKAEELGWSRAGFEPDVAFLEASNWGELKRSIDESRSEAEVLVFCGGDDELARKAVDDGRIDVLLHPEKGRTDSGLDHVTARKAAENGVAIGFDLSELPDGRKKRSLALEDWRRNLELCSKYGALHIATTGASSPGELRSPRDLASVIGSLGFKGEAAVSENPGEILRRGRER